MENINFKAALKNLGCKVNEYETMAMEKKLSDAGFTIVPFNEKADVYVINTCTVTAVADQKSRQMIRRAKRENPEAIIVCAGCFAETFLEENTISELKAETGADIVILNDEKSNIVKKINDYYENKDASLENIFIRNRQSADMFEELGFSEPNDRTRAFLKIQDGCDHFCSYCLIPYARGKSRSRRINMAIEEAEKLSNDGFKEIVITGIDIASFGKDFLKDEGNYHEEMEILSNYPELENMKGTSSNYLLLALIKRVSEIEKIQRIRFGSIDPNLITESFVEYLSKINKICPHFHLSLQSGSEEVLKRMNRHYTLDDYRNAVFLLRKYFKNPAITTDIISGFQGETDKEFEETVDFVNEIGFYEIHNFPYSIRKGTRAEKFPGRIKNVIKEQRVNKLISLSKEQAIEYRRMHIGEKVSVLFENEIHRIEKADGRKDFLDSKGFYITGFSEEYIRCALKVKNHEETDLLRHEIREGIILGFLTDDIMEIRLI